MDYSSGRLEAKRSVGNLGSYTRERLKHLTRTQKREVGGRELVVKEERTAGHGS